jgi:hypothetical protein
VRTRELILSAAFELFVHRGYPETSMEDICREAGASKGGLYHHFPTKEAVLVATLERVGGPNLGMTPSPLHEAFKAALGLPEPGITRFLIDVWGMAARSGEIRAATLVQDGTGDGLSGILSSGALTQALVFGADWESPGETQRAAEAA